MGSVATAKKIHERLGGKVRVRANQFGGAPSSFVYTIEVASWAAFGALGASMERDAEWQNFWAGAGADPSAELVSSAVIVEAPI